MSQGYYAHPTIFKNQIVFVCEEDLWVTTLEGGIARRLTAGRGGFSNAHFSSDGKQLAVSSVEDGAREVFVMPALGGELKRLTFFNGVSQARGWHQGQVLLSSWALDPNWNEELFLISTTGGEPERLNKGFAIRQSFSQGGDEVLERNGWRPEASHWKRYRGGTAGKFYIRKKGSKNYSPFLRTIKGNLSHPFWIDDRLYFLSDHEGVGNLYSVLASGKGLKKHTFEKDYYVRNLNSDGTRLVYHCAGELYYFDPATDKAQHIPVQVHSQGTHKQHKWIPAMQNLENYQVSPTGQSLAITARGQALFAPAWQGAVINPSLALEQKSRDRLAVWLKETHDTQTVAFVTDAEGKTETESLVVVDLKKPTVRRTLSANIGRVAFLKPSPDGERIALVNHRNECLVVEVSTGKSTVVVTDRMAAIGDFDWSPDSQWLVVPHGIARGKHVLSVWNVKTKKLQAITKTSLSYTSPRWSSCGTMIYFLAAHNFNPKYERERFSLFFEHLNRPYVLLLKSTGVSPLRWKPDLPLPVDPKKPAPAAAPLAVSIDFDGIEQRLIHIPAREAEYTTIFPMDKGVLLAYQPISGSRPLQGPPPVITTTLESFDFTTLKQKQVMAGLNGYGLSAKKDFVVFKVGDRLRLRKTTDIGSEDLTDNDAHPKSGWITTDRFQVPVYPVNEWKQIFEETWRLQKLFYWEKNLGGVDWDKQRAKYLKVLPKIAMRSELTDLSWELIGELGVGHAYASGGDLRLLPRMQLGFLGADYAWNKTAQGWGLKKILKGYPWLSDQQSPLQRGDIHLVEGDVIKAINGRPVRADVTINQMLLGLAGVDVTIEVQGKNKKTTTHLVKTLLNEQNLRYRDWVESCRKTVHKQSNGKLGYIHVPDMGPDGYAEFYEQYQQEFDHDGLVVDVRFNGGGHVSGLILSRLLQKRVGIDSSRWFGDQPYPFEAPRGPMVALTNEYAGSDGDIFSHSFKLYKLGPLVGTRTWGGVIGIWPRHQLMDGGSTTQPEFAFWFKDVGWGVEGHGTDPDIEIDNMPHDFEAGVDQQLMTGIKTAQNELKRNPSFNPKLPPPPQRTL